MTPTVHNIRLHNLEGSHTNENISHLGIINIGGKHKMRKVRVATEPSS